MSKKELFGPVCPCGTQIRRRIKWYRWDTFRCRKCGRIGECVDVKPVTYIFYPQSGKAKNITQN